MIDGHTSPIILLLFFKFIILRKLCYLSVDAFFKQGPSGNPEFSVRFNVKDFKPDEVKVSTKDGRLTVSGM